MLARLRKRGRARCCDAVVLAMRMGFQPDPWQKRLLSSRHKRILINGSRQSGKTTVVSYRIAHRLLESRSLAILLAPSERQSKEFLRDVSRNVHSLGDALEIEREKITELEFPNGSRAVALPGKDGTIRGYKNVAQLVIDEASRVSDDLYRAVRPMLAVSGGELIGLSTGFGKRGWYYEAWDTAGPPSPLLNNAADLDAAADVFGPTGWWHDEGAVWERYAVPATACPRIARAFLEEERGALPEAWLLQEYFCQFTEAVGQLFGEDAVERALEAGAGLEAWF